MTAKRHFTDGGGDLDILDKQKEFSYENSLHTKKVQNSLYLAYDDNCLNLVNLRSKAPTFGPKVSLQKQK